MAPSLIDAAIVIGTTLATTLFLLLVSGQLNDTTAGDLIARSPAPALEPIVNAQPTPAPSLVGLPSLNSKVIRPAATPSPAEDTSEMDDTTIQAAIDKRIQDNPELSAYVITLAVSGGAVTLDGTVPTNDLKEKFEKAVRATKGVKRVDNQLVVISAN